MFILKEGHQMGVCMALRALFLVAYAKTKTQISCAVTAQLISAFVFATKIAQSLYFLSPKFPGFVSDMVDAAHLKVSINKPGNKRDCL